MVAATVLGFLNVSRSNADVNEPSDCCAWLGVTHAWIALERVHACVVLLPACSCCMGGWRQSLLAAVAVGCCADIVDTILGIDEQVWGGRLAQGTVHGCIQCLEAKNRPSPAGQAAMCCVHGQLQAVVGAHAAAGGAHPSLALILMVGSLA